MIPPLWKISRGIPPAIRGIAHMKRRLLTSADISSFLILLLSFCLFAGQRSALGKKLTPLPVLQEDALQRGLNALKEGQFQQALEALTIAENEQPKDPRIRNFRGIALSQLGETSEAEAEYREAIRLDSHFEDAWRNLGFLLWTQHRLEDSRQALGQAISLVPNDSFARYYLGRVELEAQRYPEAFRELELSGVPWPDDLDFLLQTARGYIALGDKDEAHKNLHQAVTKPLRPGQAAQAASLFVAIGEHDPAIELLKTAINSSQPGHSAWAQFDLSLTYLMARNYQQAMLEGHRCIDLQRTSSGQASKNAAAWSLLGISQARLAHSDEAVQALRKAAALDPGNEENWLNLTRELMEASRYADAIFATQEGLAANPKSYALQLRLGAALLAAGKYPEAEASFRSLVNAGDPLPTSYVGLAQVLLREGRAEDAATVLTGAQEKIGKHFLLSYFLGLSLDRAAKRPEAAAAFREAIRLSPDSAEAHLGLGKSQLVAGQVSEAIEELQQALRLSPENVQARRLLSQAYRRIGDTERAEKYAGSPSGEPPAPEGDLVDDFFLPKWQAPESP